MRAVKPHRLISVSKPCCQSAILLLVVLMAPTALAQWSEIKADEEVVFFTTMGSLAGSAAGWDLAIRGCVYERKLRRNLPSDLWWIFTDAGRLTNAWPALLGGKN